MMKAFFTARKKDRRGGALVMAISMMALFGFLGTLYVRHMTLEFESAGIALREARAEQLARGGIEAALGDLTAGIRGGRLDEVMGTRRYSFPAFKAERGPEGIVLSEETRGRSHVEVEVLDESGKINLNHAPVSVLQRILNIDGETARNIAMSLPRGNRADGQWLWRKDDLLLRGLLTPEQYEAAAMDHVTTYTVSDHSRPLAYLNINAAAPPVLAAVLDIPLENAQGVYAKPDFTMLEQLVEAAGKDASTFNMKPDPFRPDQFPPAFSTESRCFRLRSTASYTALLGPGLREASPVTAVVEAVVLFQDGGHEILAWSAGRLDDLES